MAQCKALPGIYQDSRLFPKFSGTIILEDILLIFDLESYRS
jgi:hypothetical protein